MLSKKRNYAAVVALKATWYNAEGILLRGDDAKESSCEPPEDHGTTNVISQNNSSDIVTHSASHKIVSENNTSPNSQSAPSDTIKCAGGDKKDEVSELGSVSGSPPVIERTIENKIEHLNNAKPDGSDMVSLASGVSRTEVMSRVSTEFTETTCPSMKGLTKETYSEYIRKYGKISDVESVCTDDTRHQMDQFMLEDLEINDETPSYDGESLFVATEMCDAQAVRRILNLPHIDINAVDKNGKTVLHIASEQGFDEIVKTILSHVDLLTTAHLSKKDQNGQTALQLACGQNHFKVAQLLLQHPAQFINVNECLLTFSSFGNLQAVNYLLQHPRVEVNHTQQKYGYTSLMAASQAGHLEIVQKLLNQNKIDVNKAQKNGATPLIVACNFGHLEIVEMLLEQENIEVDQTSNNGVSPLMIASSNCHVEVVQKLLERNEIHVNKAKDNDATTPLFIACEEGHLEIVETLLEHPAVDVNEIATERDTALTIASKKGHLEIVEVLLEHPNIDFRTYIELAINDASSEGHDDIAHLLRDRADQMTLANEGNAKESSGEPEASGGIPEARPVDALSVNRAASMYAASVCGAKPGSDVESVSTNNSQRQRDMFMTEDIDSINASSYEGDSLLIATENFDAQAVGRILNHRETDVNAVDEHGNTALHIASEQGLQEVVQQILSHASLDVNKQTKNAKQSALEVACGRNHPIVVQLLLGHGNIDGENVNYCLFLSSYFGPPDVVDLLLQHSEININSDFSKLKDASAFRGTPFVGACLGGHLEIVEKFLERSEIELNKATADDGRTPFYAACQNGHLEIVEKLLERNEIQVSQAKTDTGSTQFYIACDRGHLEIVKKLLERSEVEVNRARTDVGASPFYIACDRGHLEIVEKLLERNEIEVNRARTDVGASPFYIACEQGHLEIVEKLLERNEIEVNRARTDNGATPLFMACQKGHLEIVEKLLERNEIEANKSDSDGVTSLFRACQAGHLEIVEKLLELPKRGSEISSHKTH